MKCSAGVGLLAAGVFGSSRHSDTTRPFLTSDTARSRFAASIRLIAPFWSSAPQRPQLLWFVRKSRYSCLVGAGRSGMDVSLVLFRDANVHLYRHRGLYPLPLAVWNRLDAGY